MYDVYDDSRRYTNATNTPTSDIMKEMYSINLIDHQCVHGVLGGVGAAASQMTSPSSSPSSSSSPSKRRALLL